MLKIKFDFLKIESFKKGIVFSSIFGFLSKLLVFLQSVVIAYYFGAGSSTDVYFYCFATVTLLSVFVNSLDSSVLIPESMYLTERSGKLTSNKFLNFFIFIYFFIGLLATGLIYISPVDIFVTVSNFNVDSLEKNKQILLLCIPLFTLMITTNLLVNILTSYRFFTVPMIIGLINGSFVLLFIFLFHSKLNLFSILIGQMTAYIFNISFLVYLMKKNLNWNFSFERVRFRKGILRNIGFAQAGNITSVLSSYIPMYLLSGYNPGIITALIYGQKTAEIPSQLITNQTSAVVGIKLNELFAQGNYDRLNDVFLATTRLLLFVMTPISFIMFLYGDEIITILFKRGAFEIDSVQSSAKFFRYFVLLLPMLVINAMISRLFMAGQKISQAFYYQVTFNAVLVVFIFLSVQRYGIYGYPLTLIGLHILNVLACYWLLLFFFPEFRYKPLLFSFVKILGLNIALGALIYYVKSVLEGINPFVNILLGGSCYLVILLAINWFLNWSAEVNDTIRKTRTYIDSLLLR